MNESGTVVVLGRTILFANVLQCVLVPFGNKVYNHFSVTVYRHAEVSSLYFLAHKRSILGFQIISDLTNV